MRKFQKYTLLVLLLFIGVSVVALGKYYEKWNAKKVVSAAQMEAYGKTYLQEYEYWVNKKVFPAYQKYFSFLKDKFFLIKATISNSHGAAIEFIPSKERKFQSQTVAIRVERAIFPDKGFTGDSAFKMRGRASFSKIRFEAPYAAWYVEIPDGVCIRTVEIGVNDINYPNTMIINGSNRRSDWERKVAKAEAKDNFEADFSNAYYESEEFREFVAMPELTQIATEIIAKEKKGEYGDQYGYFKKIEDLTKLDAVADVHHIKHEFTKNILAFLKEQPSWRERHWLMFYLMLASLSALWIWFLKWIWKKLSLSQRLSIWSSKKKVQS